MHVRTNVELSFGLIEGNTITGKVPMESDEGQSGISGTNWGVQATALPRAYEPDLTEPLPVNIIVTVRSLDGDTQVRALAQRNWVQTPLPVHVPIRV